jgi:hypothetical protein
MAVPVIRFSQFAVSGLSPSGSRHLKNHASYVKQLATTPGAYLDYGDINKTYGKQTTPTKAIVAMVDHMNDANNQVYNLRFWAANITDFISGTYYLNSFPSGIWNQNCNLTDASGKYTPTVLPSGQNWWRQDGGVAITASGLDAQTTQYMYASLTVDTDVPVGVYGGDAGGFQYRMTFDYK